MKVVVTTLIALLLLTGVALAQQSVSAYASCAEALATELSAQLA